MNEELTNNRRRYTSADHKKLTTREIVLPRASSLLGETVTVLMVKINTGEVLEDCPAIDPRGEEFKQLSPEARKTVNIAWSQWANRVLSRALMDPPTTEQEVSELEDRALLLSELMDLCGLKEVPAEGFQPPGQGDDQSRGGAVPPTPERHFETATG